jgi:hypothetical protein
MVAKQRAQSGVSANPHRSVAAPDYVGIGGTQRPFGHGRRLIGIPKRFTLTRLEDTITYCVC